MSSRHPFRAVAVAALVLALGACGSDDEGGGGSAATAAAVSS